MPRGRLIKMVAWLAGATLLIALIGLAIIRGYEQNWTGFGGYVDADKKAVPPKRLWDWLSLLIVPAFLALGAWLLNNSRKAADARSEIDRQNKKTLDDYFDWLTDLIIEGNLTGAKNQEARTLARTRTLTALRILDGDRKAQVLQFLYEAEMLQAPPAISLTGADFRGAILDEATLASAEIRGAYFSGATFRGANLRGADLRGCDFTKSDFGDADLTQVDFTQAILRGAKLVTAKRTDATFEDADLTGAKIAPSWRP